MLSRRRLRAPWYAAALVVVAAACGSPEEVPDTGEQNTAQQDSAQTSAPAAGGAVSCEEPPAVPGDVPTFGAQDLPPAEDLGTLTATLQTTCGPVEIELTGSAAPQTVSSFVFLAEQGYWNDSPCHRVTTDGIYVLQCGDPTGTGRGGPGYTFGIESAPDTGFYPRGTIAMARAQAPDSNGGQFFIVHGDTMLPVEGGGYTIFGRVTEGMDIIDQVAQAGVDGGGADGIPAQPISITEVEVEVEEEAPAS